MSVQGRNRATWYPKDYENMKYMSYSTWLHMRYCSSWCGINECGWLNYLPVLIDPVQPGVLLVCMSITLFYYPSIDLFH